MDNIVITSLEMENYRQYLREKITFKYSPDKNLCVIKGHNGFGKSNIFNAINWCFFGIEEHLKSEGNSEIEPICSTAALKKSGAASVMTKVRILLDTPEGEKQLERRVTTARSSGGARGYHTSESTLTIMEREGQDWKAAPYPNYIISKILPSQMRQFFFIDGEKLRVLFERIQPLDIKAAIFDLSHITLLQNAIEHLTKFKASLRRSTSDVSDLTQLEELIEQVSRDIENDKAEYGKLKVALAEAQVNRNTIAQQIGAIGRADVDTLEASKNHLKTQIEGSEITLTRLRSGYQEYLLKIAPSILCWKAIQQALEGIEQSQAKGRYPPPMPHKALIEHILGQGQCICGLDITKPENAQHRQRLEQYRHTSEVEDTIRDVNQAQIMLGQFNEECAGFQKQMALQEGNIQQIEKARIEAQQKLKDVIAKIGTIDLQKLRELQKTADHYEKVVENTQSQMNKLQASIDYQTPRLAEAERAYKEQLKKQKRHQAVLEKMETCDSCIRLLSQVKDKMMKSVRTETNRYTQDYFAKLVNAKEFDAISIQDDYELRVSRDGFNCTHSLSAAEHLCLGYSFMAALRKGSGFRAPVIIDTPIAKVDSCYRTNVAHWIKEALHVAQVILLVTDTEYTSEFRDEVKSILGEEYRIEHDKQTRTSRIIPDGD